MEAGLGRGVAAAGCDSACVEINGGRLDPFRYVLPAESPDGSHAAWYSETFAPEDGATIEQACAIVGRRDGASFTHCHGLWRIGKTEVALGHMLPPDCVAAEPIRVRGTGLRGAAFESRQDPETNFRLFAAEPAAKPVETAGSALAITLRPNQDISHALEAICADAGIRQAAIHGIGSLNGARFEYGPPMDSFASEFFIEAGRLEETPDGPRVRLDIAIVAIDGTIYRGKLIRGENPVCVTCELVVVA